MSSLVVNQVYGPVWQGEGPQTGVLASVVRFMGCNLSCRWKLADGSLSPCDEAQTWDARRYDLKAQGKRMEAIDIAEQALSCRPRLVILTGGEPLLHQDQDGWGELLGYLACDPCFVEHIEVETNGTQVPAGRWTSRVTQWNVSPKLSSSGMAHQKACNPEALRWFVRSGRAVFKFVVTSAADLDEVEQLWVRVHRLPPSRIWVMPAGTTPGELLDLAQGIAPQVVRRRWNLTLRQHVLVHGKEGEPR